MSESARTRTWRFLREIARQYPAQTATTVALLIVASCAEGMSLLVLFPTVARILRSEGAEPDGVTGLLDRMMAALGMEPGLPGLFTLVLAGVVLKGLLTWLAMRQVGCVVADLGTALRLSLLSTMFRARWGLFVREPLGRFASAMGHEATLAATSYQKVCEVFSRASQVVMNALIVFLVSWRLALVVLAVSAGVVVASGGFTRASRRSGRAGAEALKAFVGKLLDSVHGMKPIRAMGAERHFLPVLVAEAERVREALRRQVNAAEGLKAAQEPLLVAGILFGLAFATRHLEQHPAAIAILGFVLFRLAVQLRLCLGEFQYLVALEPVYWSQREAQAIAEAYQEPAPGDGERPTLEQGIRLEEVTFRYDGALVLRGVSMWIPAGRMTVLVGASGAGKTTVLDLLMGIQQPAAGEILLDGVPLSRVSLAGWRRIIGYVPQESFLVHDTIRANIALGDSSIGEAAIRAALAAAGALEFVVQLPEGLDTLIGDHGSRLSAGQRQRVALARALVRQPALLILDEVTASLDPDTARGVAETLARLRTGTTVLAVTHQQDLVAMADFVYELAGGRATPLGAVAKLPAR